MNEKSILCPFKGTMTYPSICKKKCTYSKGQCEEARAKRIAKMRPCVDCKHDETDLCKECLGVDGARTRPYWAPQDEEEAPAVVEEPKKLEQLSLFG